MNIIVQKYGGSSVSNNLKIKRVASKIKEKVRLGFKIIAVVSAMGNTTDKLLNMAKEISSKPNPRELDMLLTTGEQMSVSLLSMALQEIKVRSKSLNSFQIGIKTSDNHNNAKIKNIKKEKIMNFLKDNDVLVITGFQGINSNGDLTTLGRGGSDTSAVALAASLKTDCEIYSDYPIYTIDPKLYKNAKKISRITYDEMLEMASLGSNILHSRAVEIAKKFNVRLYCTSTFVDKGGTYVVSNTIENSVVTGMSLMKNQTRVSITHLPENHSLLHSIFENLSQRFNVDMISLISIDNKINVSLSIIEEEMENFDKYLQKALQSIDNSRVSYEHGYVKLSVVGIGMKTEKGVASRFFKSLQGIPIKLVTTSEIKISCLIEKANTAKAIEALVKEFEL